MSRWISLIVLLGIIAVTSVVLYKVMATFLLPLFLASVLTVIFRPVHTWILFRCKNRATMASAITTLVILLTVLVPLGAVFTFAVREGVGAAGGNVLDRTQQQLDRFRSRLGLDIPFRRLDGMMLRDIDVAIDQLPDQLPDRNDPETPAIAKQIAFIDNGLGLLDAALDRWFNKVVEDDQNIDQSVEAWSIRRLTRRGQWDATTAALSEMRSTLTTTNLYIRQGPEVLSNESQPEEVEEPPVDSEAEQAEDDEVIDAGGSNAGEAERKRPPKLSELRREFSGLKPKYEAMRIDLLGGPMWAGAFHLANPDVAQIDSWRVAVQKYLRSWLPSVAGQATALIGSLMLGLAIMTLSVFYFLKDGPAMVQSLMRLSPLEDKYERELLIEFDKVSRAVVLATLLSAVAQGVLAGIAYFVGGFESVFLLTSLTIVLSMVPFVGAAAVWLPAVLWLGFVEERLVAALVMLVYCFGVVSMADNVIKPYVLHGQSKLHPLLALLSVLGGVQALGPIGILVGPMIVSFLQALLNILHQELKQMS